MNQPVPGVSFTCLKELVKQTVFYCQGSWDPAQFRDCPSFPFPWAPPACGYLARGCSFVIQQENLLNFHVYHTVTEANGNSGCSTQTWPCSCQQVSHNLGVSAARLVAVYLPKLQLSFSLSLLPPISLPYLLPPPAT